VPLGRKRQQLHSLQQALAAWESAWESRNNDGYLAFYADDFSDLTRNKAAWALYKRTVNDSKRFIEV